MTLITYVSSSQHDTHHTPVTALAKKFENHMHCHSTTLTPDMTALPSNEYIFLADFIIVPLNLGHEIQRFTNIL